MQTDFFYTKTKGIKGRIKERIKDFIVTELDEQGTECTLWLNEETLDELQKLEIPENPKECKFLWMEMQKFNLDVNEAIRRIARFNGVSKKRITYAGVKDKRAITSQKICFFKPEIQRLKEFKSKFVKLGKAEWKKEKLRIGMLKGNKFEITIRKIELEKKTKKRKGKAEKEIKETEKKEEIKELETRIKNCFKEMEKGIPNYFGEQRFGGIRKVSHLVGKEFIKGNIKEGVMLYLTHTNESEEEEIRNARNKLKETGNYAIALKEFPLKFRYERGILDHLNSHEEDFVGAFRVLPKALRYMFVHAYQSFLFNKIIEERINSGIGLEKTEGEILVNGLASAPLIGFETVFAEGKTGEIEKKVFEEEDIELKQFYVKEMKEMSSKGARKEIVLFPENLELKEISEDEFEEGKLKAKISFYLPKGNYATTVLKEIMK
ncbi:tRNA pseudouridine(13) synthase TruD [Candidatus Micrarchaeota archaeon]|nr:tRNA pseudouridine(13) synthase TruD [Candidatus Micrarchaeota archaeon]MBU2476019.1 tRNA pseudouridine(13) synthase TruD [Candidatus Micrarchaeota archaeon]